jgi:ATP-binding cassette subfamily F protein uup
MVLVRLKQAELAFGDHVLLDKVDLDIQSGERLCVVGRNGEGKSTLLKILNRQVQPDDGRVEYRDLLRVSALQQELPQTTHTPVYDVIAEGLGDVGLAIAQYHDESAKGADADLKKLEQLQTRIEAADGWRWQQKVEAIIQKLNLPGESMFSELSGGWQRRVMLARALVVEPDLLILDEPTNHMDVATIEWLEEQLKQFNGALVFISHDRAFVQNLATRIVELDRGHLYQWQGDYLSFVEYREKRLEDEATQNALFDKRLSEEEKWIRQGVKARRTRNEGRVERLKEMRKERKARREVQGSANISMNAAESSGKQVFEIEHLTYAWKDVMQVNDFSTTVMRGDRIGLIGPNGVGKSTLLKLLLGKLEPQSGTIKCGTRLEVAYFDQARHQLDEEKSIADNVADGKDQVEVNGQSRHIIGYLGDFLFAPARARTPVKALSGGERNRVLLAKLFLKPCNLLVMDEPTNDLDVETGASEKAVKKDEPASAIAPAEPKKKLSYKLQRELDLLPEQIAAAEAKRDALAAQTADANFYSGDAAQVQAVLAQLADAEAALEALEERWLELEEMTL